MRRTRLLYSLGFTGPGVVLLLIFFVVPLLRMAGISFYDHYPNPASLTLHHYAQVLEDSLYWAVTWNSVKLAVIVTLLTAALGYPIAYYMVRSHSRYKHWIFLGVISPLLVSVVVRTLGWMMILGSEGLINSLLVSLHLRRTPDTFLNNFPAIVLGMVHVLLPFMALSISSVLRDIDPRLEEAAAILGARPAATFRKITLPLSMQGIAAGGALVFSLTVGAYVTPFFLGGGKVPLLATTIFDQTLVLVDWTAAATTSLVLMVFALAASLGYVILLERLARR